MTCLQKYKAFRDRIQDGDIGLCWSRKLIAKGIQLVDSAFYHHSFIAYRSYDRVMCMDSHPGKGTHPAYLSHRIVQQKWDGFIILRPNIGQSRINNALCNSFRLAEAFIPYDLIDIARILKYELTGKWTKSNTEKMICSEFTQYYCINLGFDNFRTENLDRPFFTPQDHIRYMEPGQFTILEP